MVILKLFIISTIWVLILDLCGFAHTVDILFYRLIYKKRTFREDAHFPPFDCSMCMTFWTGLAYLLITHSFTIPYLAFLLLFAWLTTIERDIFIFAKDLITKLITLLYDTFKL